jgi:hypothetical protein
LADDTYNWNCFVTHGSQPRKQKRIAIPPLDDATSDDPLQPSLNAPSLNTPALTATALWSFPMPRSLEPVESPSD